jgi:hypothetical protein
MRRVPARYIERVVSDGWQRVMLQIRMETKHFLSVKEGHIILRNVTQSLGLGWLVRNDISNRNVTWNIRSFYRSGSLKMYKVEYQNISYTGFASTKINKTDECRRYASCHAFPNLLCSRLLSGNTKIKIHTTVCLPVVLWVWILVFLVEGRTRMFKVFENRVLVTIVCLSTMIVFYERLGPVDCTPASYLRGL